METANDQSRAIALLPNYGRSIVILGNCIVVNPMKAGDVLDREYLEIRAKILELSASLDRLDRGGRVEGDPRVKLIQDAIAMLDFDCDDRAEKVQFIFSRDYDGDWRKKFGLD